MNENKEPIEKIDWRARVATTIAEDTLDSNGEVIHSKGTPITLTTFSKYNDREIDYSDPSATALFLNHSHKSYVEAMSIHPLVKEWPPSNEKPSTRVFDYLEAICASIIFAYTSLESFANEEIPDDFEYDDEQQTDSGVYIVQKYNKQQIERTITLSEKLSAILPIIFDLPSPKGNSNWEGFVHLLRFRNRIIHMKSHDREPSKHGYKYPESIWNDLLDPIQRNYPLIAKSMILSFKSVEDTHWLKYCPF